MLPQFTTALATHSIMMQVAATDSESGRKMIPFIKAIVDGTIWEDKFSAEYE